MRVGRIDDRITYDGSQLRAHWIRRRAGMIGDAMVAFRGPCAVRDDEMADVADLLEGSGIAADDMVHFVQEIFDDGDLLRAVLRQRLLSAMALEVLRRLAPTRAMELARSGDDLFLVDGKLSVSIATRSPVSTLIHFGVNVDNAGTPVKTASLADLRVDPSAFMAALLDAVHEEEASVVAARCQVRAKGEA